MQERKLQRGAPHRMHTKEGPQRLLLISRQSFLQPILLPRCTLLLEQKQQQQMLHQTLQHRRPKTQQQAHKTGRPKQQQLQQQHQQQQLLLLQQQQKSLLRAAPLIQSILLKRGPRKTLRGPQHQLQGVP